MSCSPLDGMALWTESSVVAAHWAGRGWLRSQAYCLHEVLREIPLLLDITLLV